MNILKMNCNLVVFGFILFFIYMICCSILPTEIEAMSLSETANEDSAKTDLLIAKATALQPLIDNTSKSVNDNATSIKANMDLITSVLKQKVNDVNKKVGKDITDKNNAPPPVTGLT
jgi:hypothetical protein